jgi:hypothetical protein
MPVRYHALPFFHHLISLCGSLFVFVFLYLYVVACVCITDVKKQPILISISQHTDLRTIALKRRDADVY